ncbi:hypothetical protein FISHEDRAFT_47922 [Fistulina hepatica ATCC 64428]|uniref:RRM domain-containing protein n=1 Tax=Fistulina hepatica ATCC 64428 TaxID=1128425 RepID=A0A0D7A6U7_9AGAR|nr:hypothetical protein FISHEDRAFT_47922 [Fistulina hepatica ATCC 64428]
MDDPQPAFQSYPVYFDLDMMKRSMDSVGGPDAKKARWSPNTGGRLDPFANYGYGPHASISQVYQPSSSPAPAFASTPLYSTPSLNINTHATGATSQMSPSPAGAYAQSQPQQHTQSQQPQQGSPQPSPNGASPYASFGMYNMLGMGVPMNALNFQYSNQMANFAQVRRVPSMSMQNQQVPYSPVTMASSSTPAGRTVYIGNLPAAASVDELLNLVHFGPLESVRVLPEKSCVFLSFLDSQTAASFHADATIKKLSLHGQELKIGWGKPSQVPAQVAMAINQSNASRNVYLGGLDEGTTEESLRDELSRFGLIDQVKIIKDKNIGFVHFLSISVATKVVNTLPTEPAWAGKRVNYGKDRCAYVPKSQQAAAQQAQAAAAQSLVAHNLSTPQTSFAPFSPYPPFTPTDMTSASAASGPASVGMNRTVYLGNIHPDTTTEDLCNAVRGGVLQSIRYMHDKHIAFATFIDPAAAYTFFQVSTYNGLMLNNRRLKIGWGKNSGPLAPSFAMAVHAGATRNVYIGNIEDFETFTEERLKQDFGEFGEIELVNFLKEKNCAFVNFTNIANAIKAIEGIKSKPEYSNLRIAHGKDRCANPPRSGPQGGPGGKRQTNGNHSHGHGHAQTAAAAAAEVVLEGEDTAGVVEMGDATDEMVTGEGDVVPNGVVQAV